MRSQPELDAMSTAEVAAMVRDGVAALSRRSDPEAFGALVELTRIVGESLGESARALAGASSWAQVGDVAGTSRQAAWERWRG
ncbi:MAG TPA: hypothetical protein VIP75_03205 [Acidothermales bacterium]|jgi:hypothetical protein|nr:hypothetical protein [Actinomycetes bacterium]